MNKKLYFVALLLMLTITMFAQDWYLRAFDAEYNIEVRVDTLYGTFAIGTHSPAQNLTWHYTLTGSPEHYGNGNSVVINLGGTTYRSATATGGIGDENLDDFYAGSYYDGATNTIVTTWEISPPFGSGLYTVSQRVHPTIDPTDTLGTIKIEYEIENTSIAPVTAGVKLLINPRLDEEEIVPVAVGPYYTEVGLLFWETDSTGIPTTPWQAFEEGIDYSGDQLVARGVLSEDPPDLFGLGEYPHAPPVIIGLTEFVWKVFPDEPLTDPLPGWVNEDYIDCGAMLRWNLAPINPRESRRYETYYGLGAPIPPDTTWATLGLTPSAPSADSCDFVSFIDITPSITNNTLLETAESTIVCIEVSGGGCLTLDGRTCDTLGTLEGYGTRALDLRLRISPGCSDFGDVIDTIRFNVTTVTPTLDDITFIREFRTPYINHLPPVAEFVDSGVVVNCSTFVRFYVTDEDTAVDWSSCRISLQTPDTTYRIDPYEGIFDIRNDTVYFGIDDVLITLGTEDTLNVHGNVNLCIYQLSDFFECQMDTFCGNVIFDIDPPYIENIIPGPGANVTDCSQIIEIAVADAYAGVNPSSARVSISGMGEFTIGSPELSYSGGASGSFVFTPSTPFTSGDLLEVCLIGLADNIPPVPCTPNVMADTCWTYWVDCEPPGDAVIIRPTAVAMVSCEVLDSMIILINDHSGILLDSLRIDINGTIYDGSLGELHLGATIADYDTIIFYNAFPLVEGSVNVNVYNFYDSLGNYSSDILNMSFTVDQSPPVYGTPIPPDGSPIGWPPTCRIPLTDAVPAPHIGDMNLDSTSIRVTMEGFEIYLRDGFYWDAGTLYISASMGGIEDGDSVTFCLTDAADYAQYCDGPNHIEDSLCWTYFVDSRCPEHNLMTAFDGAHISCCGSMPINIEFSDSSGIDPESVLLYLDGAAVTGYWDPPIPGTHAMYQFDLYGVEYTGCTDIEINVSNVGDMLGNACAGTTWTYRMDCEPPMMVESWPSGIVPHDDAWILFEDYDTCSQIFIDSTIVIVNTHRDGSVIVDTILGTDPLVDWSSGGYGRDTLAFRYSDLGIMLENNDSVVVCIARLSDSLDYYAPGCGYNVLTGDGSTEYCFSYTISFAGPIVTVLTPPRDAYVPCQSFGFEFTAQDEDGIDSSSFEFYLDGASYDYDRWIGNPLDGDRDTIIIDDPDGSYRLCDTIFYEVRSLEDGYGTAMASEMSSFFIVDTVAPVAYEFIPAGGDTLVGEDKKIMVIIRDPMCGSLEGAGVDQTTLVFTIDGTDYPVTEPFVYWHGDTAIFDIDSSSVPIYGGEEIDYCVRVNDNTVELPEPRCERNELNTCSSFFMTSAGPEIVPVRPRPNQILGCVDIDSFIVRIEDSEGIDWTTFEMIVDGEVLTVDDIHDLGGGLISYRFVPRIIDEGPIAISITVSDVVGNESSISYTFSLDHTSPEVTFLSGCGDTVDVNQPELDIMFTDEISRIDTSSVCIGFCQPTWATCTTYCVDTSPGLFWVDDSTLRISTIALGYMTAGGDSGLYYVANAADVVDTCDANIAVDRDSCSFYVSSDGPVVSLVSPLIDGMTIGCPIPDFCFKFRIIDPDGLDLDEMELEISGVRLYELGAEFSHVAGDTFSFCEGDVGRIFSDDGTTNMTVTAADLLGNFTFREFSFTYDTLPPGCIVHEPPLTGAGSLSPDLIFEFPDSTGPDTLAITITLTDPDDIVHSYTAPDPGIVLWQNDSLTIVHGLVFETNDTIEICINQVVDAVDTCPNFNPDIMDSCWQIPILQGGPAIVALSPADGGFGCPDECFTWGITDDDGVVAESINLIYNEDTFTVADPELTFSMDTLEFCPSEPISETIVNITIEGCEDSLGYEAATRLFTYYFDVYPPVVSDFEPVDTSAVYEAEIMMTVLDSLNPVNPDSLRLFITEGRGATTTEYHLSDPEVNWNDSLNLLTFNSDGSYAFRADDSIVVCLEIPDSTGCSFDNWTDTCFVFYTPIGDGPRFSLVSPSPNGCCVSCSTFSLVTVISSIDPVDTSTLRMVFESDLGGCLDTFTNASPEITFSDGLDSMTFEIPAGCIVDGASLSMDILEFFDIYGNAASAPLFSFTADFSGPYVIDHGPVDPVSMSRPEIWFVFADDGCDIDTNSIVLHIDGSRYINDENVRWSGDTAFVIPTEEDRFTGGDVVEICVDTLLDVVDASLCAANNLDSSYCFNVTVSAGGPIPSLLMPVDASNSSCDDQQIIIAFADSQSIVESSIQITIADVSYDYTAGASWSLVNDTLTFSPLTGAFTDGQVVVVSVDAGTDSIGNPIVGDYSWSFTVDLTPPYADSIIPAAGEVVYDWTQPITIYPRDMYSDLGDSVMISISEDGMTLGNYTMADAALTFNALDSSYTFDPGTAGLSFSEFNEVCVDFWISDSTGEIEYCPYNDTTISWCFEIGDDDTTGPEFACDSCAWAAFTDSIYITMFIDDPSGVYDDGTDTSGQGVYVEIDTIGTFDPAYTTIIPMDRDSLIGNMFYSLPGGFPAENLREGIHFCYRVFAYDNDFDFNNADDRQQASSDTCCCFIYNTDPPELTVLDPIDASYYSCTCADTQKVTFALHDFDHVRVEDLVIEINNVEYSYPDPRITVVGPDTLKTVYWTPLNEEECFENGERITARIWDYSDRFLNYPEDTAEWVFIADQTPPILHYDDQDSIRLYVEDVTEMSLYLEDDLGEIDPTMLQIEIQVNDELPQMFDISSMGLEYDSSRDSLYIDMYQLGLDPMARDSIFITIIGACDNAIGCGPNCAEDYTFRKFIKYETECASHPKPFSPNNDDYNDIAKIEYPKRFDRDAIVTIYDIDNKEMKKVKTNNASQYLWDGTDANGYTCRQGVYLFVVEVEGEVVCSGTIVLAR